MNSFFKEKVEQKKRVQKGHALKYIWFLKWNKIKYITNILPFAELSILYFCFRKGCALLILYKNSLLHKRRLALISSNLFSPLRHNLFIQVSQFQMNTNWDHSTDHMILGSEGVRVWIPLFRSLQCSREVAGHV